MNRKRFVAGASVLALGTAALIGVARAQPARLFPDPGDVKFSAANAGLAWTPNGAPGVPIRLVTTEPAEGFVGACLTDFMTYQPALPLACYVPGYTVRGYAAFGSDGKRTAGGFTTVKFPAKDVLRAHSGLSPNYDSYQVLLGCYPHEKDGTCPTPSHPVSRSCCDYGAYMTSLDGQTAQGMAFFQ